MRILHKKRNSGEDVYYVTHKNLYFKFVYEDGRIRENKASDRDTFKEKDDDSDFEAISESELPGSVHSKVYNRLEIV